MKAVKTVVSFFAGAAVAAATVACAEQTGSFSTNQVTEIQNIVHSYLVQHPEVLVEASQALQQQQTDHMRGQAVKAALANQAALLNDPVSPVVGNAKGTVTLIEFFDYQCPHCIEMFPVIDSLIKKNPNLRVIFKEFPIFGAVSDYASSMSLVAYKQGKYFAFHDALLHKAEAVESNRKQITLADIDGVAKKAGLNLALAKQQIKSEAFGKELKNNRELASQLGLVGTPAFLVVPSDLSATTNPELIGFVPGQTTETQLQGLIDKVK